MDFVTLLVVGLATWRLSSLLANEAGPFDVLARIRHKVGVRYSDAPPYDVQGTNTVSKGIICIWCNSVWIGVVFTIALMIYPNTVFILLPLAFSTIAIWFDELFITD
jgi:hypothetical protein